MHPQSDTLTRFGDVLDAVVGLSPDEQLALVEIVGAVWRNRAEHGWPPAFRRQDTSLPKAVVVPLPLTN